MNYYYKQNLKYSKINSVQIKIACYKSIKKWGSRKLPNGNIVGEIKTSQTMNYKTLKPEHNGLFCERIFGPINDFECACGKRCENEFIGFCAQCGIEFISSQVRRSRLGYIKLISPVIHIWYIKYIALLLDIPIKSIDSMVYCTDEVVFRNKFKSRISSLQRNIILSTNSLKNDSKLFKLTYSLYIQKSILSYLKSIKKAIFIIKLTNNEKKKFNFNHLYYALNSFYSLSYSCQWEIKKQWSTIIWYLKYKRKFTEKFIYNDENQKNFSTNIFYKYENKFFFGTKIIYSWLKYFDYNFQLSNLERQIKFHIFEIKEEIKELSGLTLMCFYKSSKFFNLQKKIKKLQWQKDKIFRRLKLIVYFRQAKIQPKWMILSILPVLPPDLRPIVELGSNKIAVSDLNKSYQTIILRNLRLKKFHNNTSFNSFTEEVRYTKRLLQEAVDELIQQDKSKKSENKKSLSDILKGKKGRFRQNLLGKRVDYSGRSVIIVDPELKLHECGVPLKMIIELFHPFIIKHLISFNIVKTIPGAKQFIRTNSSYFLNILTLILRNYLVLLNRAPTLHKLGIQAFQPKLIKGKAIRLHPLVCPAFNADFDGDQMGIHIPLSFESRSEAWKLLWSRNNLVFSNMGTPVLTPGQDVVLGCYYLTSKITSFFSNYSLLLEKKKNKKLLYFQSVYDVIKAYDQNKIGIHTEIWIKWKKKIFPNYESIYPNELQIYENKSFSYNYSDLELFYNSYGYQINQFIKTTVGRIIFNSFIKIL